MKAYSYLRFSTPEQRHGDSLARQTEAARRYAEAHGLQLDDELKFHDLGTSAFRGDHAATGKLGEFLQAVREGKVERGAFLLVENLDRLSRENVLDALPRFIDIIQSGIIIVTLSDGQEYSSESVGNDWTRLMLSLVVMARANEESKRKSEFATRQWNNNREAIANGKRVRTYAPGWLRFNPDSDEYETIPERVAVVRRIFALAIEGHGKISIARQLNEDGVPTFGEGNKKADAWDPGYIRKILNNEAIIGRFQPHRRAKNAKGKTIHEPFGPVVEGYYPCVLDNPDDFFRVRPGVSSYQRTDGAGRELVNNVLAGLVRCAHCGGKMHYHAKGRGFAYYICDNAKRKGTCDHPGNVSFRLTFNAVRRTIVDREGFDLAALLGRDNGSRRAELAARLEAIEGRIQDAATAVDNLLDGLSRRASTAIERRLEREEKALEALRTERDEVEREMRSLVNGDDPVEDLYGLLSELDNAGPEINIRLNAALKRVVDHIALGKGMKKSWMGKRDSYAAKIEQDGVGIGIALRA